MTAQNVRFGVVSRKLRVFPQRASKVVLRVGGRTGRIMVKGSKRRMENQGLIRFDLPRNEGEAAHSHDYRKRLFNQHGTGTRRPSRESLLAELLKGQANRVMADVSECDPLQLPAHLARLDALRELFNHVLNYWLAETKEAVRSGRQLQYPSTMADYLACLEITRQRHRAPAFVNQRDADIADIKRGIHLIAGLLSRSPALPAILDAQNVEVES